MIATIDKVENGYIAQFERHFMHPLEKVWSYLTENEKLAKWFPELSVDHLHEGGSYKFDMQDGTFLEFTITEFSMYSILEFMWDEDRVRFELSQESQGCKLVLQEKIGKITDHTPKDLAGWHVCLDVIQALLDGRKIERKGEWKKWYEKYIQAVEQVAK